MVRPWLGEQMLSRVVAFRQTKPNDSDGACKRAIR
jgi:hypothetical protein